MNIPFVTKWSDEARLTFNCLPTDVQDGLIKQSPDLVKKQADLYQRRPAESACVGTSICSRAAGAVPGLSMGLRLETEYHENEVGSILFIYRFDELSGIELE